MMRFNNVEIIVCDTKDTVSGCTYPLSEMQFVVNEINKKGDPILGEYAIGANNSYLDLSLVTHKVINLRFDGCRLLGDVEIINSPKGKILQEFITETNKRVINTHIKCVPRGFGVIDENLIISCYNLTAIDIEFLVTPLPSVDKINLDLL